MFRSFGKPCLALTAVAALLLVNPAEAGPRVAHRESCDGTLTRVVLPTSTSPGVQDFAGQGVASHFGRYRIVGGHTFTPDGRLNGTFTTTAADGSTISGSYSGSFREIAPNVFQFNVVAVWERGTGRLAGVTGRGDVVAVVRGIGLGSPFHYEQDLDCPHISARPSRPGGDFAGRASGRPSAPSAAS